MRRFKFKLATVLKVKNRVEEERLRQLQRVESVRQAARQQLQQCQGELTVAMQEYQCRMKERFDRYLAVDYHQYVSWLNQKIKTASACLQQCEIEVAHARQCLLVATKERKILDKLRERAYHHYQREELQADLNFMDELGTGRFIRRESRLTKEEQ
jgi:flagellar FliJ protein